MGRNYEEEHLTRMTEPSFELLQESANLFLLYAVWMTEKFVEKLLGGFVFNAEFAVF